MKRPSESDVGTGFVGLLLSPTTYSLSGTVAVPRVRKSGAAGPASAIVMRDSARGTLLAGTFPSMEGDGFTRSRIGPLRSETLNTMVGVSPGFRSVTETISTTGFE